MKKIIKITLSLILILMMTKCIKSTYINSKGNSFIVTEIKRYNRYNSIYISDINTTLRYQKIILPTGWFNIGDTIKLIPVNYKLKNK